MIKSSENLHFFIAVSLAVRYLSLGCDKYFAVGIWIEHMSGIRLVRNKKETSVVDHRSFFITHCVYSYIMILFTQ